MPPKLAQQVVDLVQQLRTVDLRKIPSMSETIDWARALVELNVRHLDRTTIDTTLNVLLKYESDVQKAKRLLQPGGDSDDDQPRMRRDRERDRDRDRRRS